MPILVGTCSWTDKTLIACKRFYPAGCGSAEARLRFYASQFPLVEVDSSYYALPSVDNARRWVDRTPDGFVFNVKAFRLFTGHPMAVEALPKDLQPALGAARRRLYYRDVPSEIRLELWRRFREAIEPLAAAGRLRLVHFQFAPWMAPKRADLQHVRHCVENMAGFQVSVEFRNRIWFDEAHLETTLAFERELGVVHTVVDAPQGFPSSVPAVWAVTHPRLGYVRLHGRNAGTWNIQGEGTTASDRFNYDYPEDQLADLAGRIRSLATEAFEVQAVFNNNMEDQGQRNARTLIRLLLEQLGQ